LAPQEAHRLPARRWAMAEGGGVMGTDHRPDLRLAVGIGAIVVLATAGPAVWAWWVRDRLPDEVARHWGVGEQVTGTWPLTTQLLVLGAMTAMVAGGIGAVAVLSRQPVAVRRLLTACAVWTATLLGATEVDALRGQLDLADAFVAPMPVAGLLVGGFGGLLVGIAVAMLATEPPHRVLAYAPPIAGLPRHQVTATTSYEETPVGSRGMLAVLAGCLVIFVVPSLLGSWWVLLLGLLVLAPVGALTRFRVRIDRDGLGVTSMGFGLVRVPLDEVAGARPIEHLDAFWEFGGWGLRVDAHGRTGVVARSGPAVAVTRADGSEVVVSVGDAQRAAGVLNAFADQRTTDHR
jgi:hypothetical protein